MAVAFGKIGFIGAGNMAGAIIAGILKKNLVPCGDIAVYDIDPVKCERFRSRGIHALEGIDKLAAFCDILFLSVKPQNFDEVLDALRPYADDQKIIVSIAAGITSGYIKSRLGFDCKIVRVMPNTPLLIGEGATALCKCPPIGEQDFQKVLEIFKSGGVVEVLPEEKMNAVIAVNSSSPAYVYLFAKAMIDGAAKLGIDENTAKPLVFKTIEGAAKMLSQSGYTPEELIKMVSSPGGTTLKALEAMYERGFEDIVIDAMERCTARAGEIGK